MRIIKIDDDLIQIIPDNFSAFSTIIRTLNKAMEERMIAKPCFGAIRSSIIVNQEAYSYLKEKELL